MIVIRGAEVYDPAHGIRGEVRDVWIDGDRIVASPQSPEEFQVLDAHGCFIAPAGVEIHTHVAGYGLNAARRFLLGQEIESDSLLPSARVAAQRYLELGYTTVMDAASSPLFSRSTLSDLQNMPGVDCGSYTLMGDHKLLLKSLETGNMQYMQDMIAWLLLVSGGYAVKLVNPGAATAWKANQPAPGLDDPIGAGDLTQRKIILSVVAAVNSMKLPHPVHLHAAKLGQPGNYQVFCDTVKALEGQRVHLCHIQFYGYGMDDKGGYTSAAEEIVKAIESNKQLTVDVGQVIPGMAMAITSDTSALDYLRRITHKPWISKQIEAEGGINTLPLEYLPTDPSSAVQWATGLELLLRFPDPTRMFLTTDHPNGGSFMAYPQVIEWLMSKSSREAMLAKLHKAGKQKSGLADCSREYTISEIIAMTSWGPAIALGLKDRGHLGDGGLADIRCYKKGMNIKAMFEHPVWVIRRGKVAYKNENSFQSSSGKLLVIHPGWDRERQKQIHRELGKMITIQPEHYGLGTSPSIENEQEVPCG